MDYKLIATDLDGTLLTSEKAITPRSRAAIEYSRSKGVAFTIASGRPYVSAKRFINQLGLDAPAILYNGCRLVEQDGRVLSQLNLSMPDARRVFALAKELDITAVIWADEQLYTNRKDARCIHYQTFSGLDAPVLENLDSLEAVGITKILWMAEAEKIKEVRRLAEKESFESLTICTSDPEYLEFFSAKASKGAALEQLAKLLGIEQSQVIALGDEENDISMLQYAGAGVAMGGASERVRGFANMSTEDCDNEGFAKALEKLLQ